MSRQKSQRISTTGGSAEWVNPFASLDLGPLPPGPQTEPSPAPAPPSTNGIRLLMRRETAHRGGKTVLILEGFPTTWSVSDLKSLLQDIKANLGCGGKVAGYNLEIQGEQADRLSPHLAAQGFIVKRGW